MWHQVESEEKFAMSGIECADRMRNPPQHKGFSVRRRELLGFDPMAGHIAHREVQASGKPKL
jgi:hypothetical protein